MLGQATRNGSQWMAIGASALAASRSWSRARHRRSKARCRRISPGSCSSSAASSIRPRPPRSTRRCTKRALSGRQDRTRRQIRRGRAQPARRVHARGTSPRAAGADLRSWRRLRRRQQAQPRQPVLRQHHAVGGEERLCRRQHHLPAGAAIAMARRRGGYGRRRAMGLGKYRRARRRSPHASS